MLTRRAGDGERGSVLALVPAGFLVLMVLGALTVDSAATYLGQRQLHDALAAAANDAVTAGLSNRSFYKGGRLDLDPGVTAATVCEAVAAQGDSGLHGMKMWMAIQGDTLDLRATATVDAVFGRVVPGFGSRQVSAAASALAATGPSAAATRPAAPYVPLDCPGPG